MLVTLEMVHNRCLVREKSRVGATILVIAYFNVAMLIAYLHIYSAFDKKKLKTINH